MTRSIVKHTHWLQLADVKRSHRRAHFQYGVSWEERKVELLNLRPVSLEKVARVLADLRAAVKGELSKSG